MEPRVDIQHATIDQLSAMLAADLEQLRKGKATRDPSRVAVAVALAAVALDLCGRPPGQEGLAITELIERHLKGWTPDEREIVEFALNIPEGLDHVVGARRRALANQPNWHCTRETIFRHENVCFAKLASVLARDFLQARPAAQPVDDLDVWDTAIDEHGEEIDGYVESMGDLIPWTVLEELTTAEYEQVALCSAAAQRAQFARGALWWVIAAGDFAAQGLIADGRDAIYLGLFHLAYAEWDAAHVRIGRGPLGPFSKAELAHLGKLASEYDGNGIVPGFASIVENDPWGARLALAWKDFLESCTCVTEPAGACGSQHLPGCPLAVLEEELLSRDLSLVAVRSPLLEGAAARIGSEWRPRVMSRAALAQFAAGEATILLKTDRSVEF